MTYALSFLSYVASSLRSFLRLVCLSLTLDNRFFSESRSFSSSEIFEAWVRFNVRASSISYKRILVSSSSILILVSLSFKNLLFKIAERSARSFFSFLLSFSTETASTRIAKYWTWVFWVLSTDFDFGSFFPFLFSWPFTKLFDFYSATKDVNSGSFAPGVCSSFDIIESSWFRSPLSKWKLMVFTF